MESRIEELQKRFPAFTRNMCKEMIEMKATGRQLKRYNEREKERAFQKVKAFIPTKDRYFVRYKVLNIVLIGKTGAGKSTTGNLILGRDCFEASSSAQSCTQTIKVRECVINGVTIRVADTPGLIDTRRDDKSVISELLEIGEYFEEGIHAFFFIRSLANSRFTREEKNAFRLFKEAFSDVALRHCIFLFTRAQEILHMNDLQEKTIEGWVNKNLAGDVDIESVNYRLLGVENIHVSPLERQMQREGIVSYIQTMITHAKEETFNYPKW